MSSGHPPHLRCLDPSDARAEGAEDSSGSASAGLATERTLRERLLEVASDRAAPANQVVLETARIFRDWILERPGERGRDGAELEAELAPWCAEQAWRGSCAFYMDSVRRAWGLAAGGNSGRGAGDVLAAEMNCWLREDGSASGNTPWSGEPLAPGRRLPSRAALAERAGMEIERGENVLITSWSETLALALEAAWRAGRRPTVLIGEGLPNLDGRRMARRLARAGIPVTMVYDSAVLALIPRADRLWLATEAIGAGAFLARTGTRGLLEECARCEVPVRVLATSDKLVPGGDLLLPAWCESESWLLWEDAPEGVRLEAQIFEVVPIELAGGFLTEAGSETTSALHLRALRVEAAPPCGARSATTLAHTT
jgi:hypothetical protein